MTTNTRARGWCFTINNPTEVPNVYGKCKYCIYQLEKGDNDTEHYQGYIEFQNQRRFSTVKKLLGKNAHIERRQGTRDQARDYCMKSQTKIGETIEVGEWIAQGQRKDLEEIAKTLKKRTLGEMADEYPAEFVRYHRGFKALKSQYNDTARGHAFRKPSLYVFWGETGTGKTRKAYSIDPELYKLAHHDGQTLWFDGYDGQRTILIDEFYGGIKFGQFLELIDGYPMKVQIKGGFTKLNHERLIITSNDSPNDWYPNVTGRRKDAMWRKLNEFGHIEEFKQVQTTTTIQPEPITLINDELY